MPSEGNSWRYRNRAVSEMEIAWTAFRRYALLHANFASRWFVKRPFVGRRMERYCCHPTVSNLRISRCARLMNPAGGVDMKRSICARNCYRRALSMHSRNVARCSIFRFTFFPYARPTGRRRHRIPIRALH
ncbi:hypothetical protein Bcep1808_3865 [Burkholderia vietnamiensis G4]|uniref:Uncharacterized protein n=1 Tax=Burkholderia vietnamiensis (strain G4 / LMG 22486) TaxID=269482 RepID=A4JKP4_BURVG|nr:hypothetical protein Bcep1808_3865 [Burkholderia vietnamiensis G4]